MFFSVKNSTNLATADLLNPQSVYNVSVFAKNGVGESNASNIVEYTRLQLGKWKQIYMII